MRSRLTLSLVMLAGAMSLAIAGACTPRDATRPAGSPQPGDRKSVPAPIESLGVVTRESFPPGYTLQITSGLPSGCARFEAAAITARSANTITVSVTNTMPADPGIPCTTIYGLKQTNLDLGQDFVSGQRYLVKVNDRQTTFTAQ